MPSLGTPCQPFCQPPSLKRGRGPGPGQECHPGDLAEDTGLRERLRPHLWAPGGWGRGLSKSPKGHSCPSGGGSSPTCVRSPECLSAMQAVLRGRGWRCGGSVSGWHSPLGATAAGAGSGAAGAACPASPGDAAQTPHCAWEGVEAGEAPRRIQKSWRSQPGTVPCSVRNTPETWPQAWRAQPGAGQRTGPCSRGCLEPGHQASVGLLWAPVPKMGQGHVPWQ